MATGDAGWWERLNFREVATFIVSMTTISGFFALLWAGKIPNTEFVIGALIGWVAASLQFYVGSSQGSTIKGDTQAKTIEKLVEKAP